MIETGKTQGDFIEVTKNLPLQDTEIIEEGARSVNNGQVVKVINKKLINNGQNQKKNR